MEKQICPSRHGDMVATLYRDHSPWLQRWLRRLTRCPDEALDFTHDTFRRLIQAPRALPSREPRPCLATIARRPVIDERRRARVERACLQSRLLLMAGATEPDPCQVAEAIEQRSALAGFTIRDSALSPVKADSYELGWRGRFGKARGTLARYRTTSDLGAVQSYDNGLVILRTSKKISGVEATLDVGNPRDPFTAGATVTWSRGRERPTPASPEQAMNGYRVPPLKITGYVEARPAPAWSTRLQGILVGDGDYRLPGPVANGTARA